MKKTSVCVLSIIFCMGVLFTGCAQRANKLTVITLWHYYSAGIKTQFDTLVQEFNETVGKKKRILVDSYSQGGVNELANAVFAAANKDIGSKPMPNIFAAYSDNVYRLDKLGVVAELDAYFTTKEIDSYRREFIEDGRLGEEKKLKIIPIAKSTELLFINATAFDEFAKETGAKYENLTTWEGLAKTAETYYNWSGGKALFGQDSMANFMIIAAKQLGADIFTATDGRIQFNLSKENAKKIWDVFYVPFISGYSAAVGRFRSDDVKSGSIIMFTGSNSSASFFPNTIETGKTSSYAVESAVLPFPVFAGKENYAIHQGAGMVITKSDEKTEKACAEFLKWLTAPEQNLEFAVSTAYLPVTNAALSYEATIKQLGGDDPSNILVQTARAVYDMLAGYDLYSSLPFEKSFEARNILNHSLSSYALADSKKIQEQIAAGKNRTELIRTYAGESNFTQWYTQLTAEIANLLH